MRQIGACAFRRVVARSVTANEDTFVALRKRRRQRIERAAYFERVHIGGRICQLVLFLDFRFILGMRRHLFVELGLLGSRDLLGGNDFGRRGIAWRNFGAEDMLAVRNVQTKFVAAWFVLVDQDIARLDLVAV